MTPAEPLSETVEEAQHREAEAFEALLAKTEGKAVLCGVGHSDRKAAAALRSQGVELLAFLDNDSKAVEPNVNGRPISSPLLAAKYLLPILFLWSVASRCDE